MILQNSRRVFKYRSDRFNILNCLISSTSGKNAPHAGQAWWDDLRPAVAKLVEARTPKFEANEIDGIDLYLSASVSPSMSSAATTPSSSPTAPKSSPNKPSLKPEI
jgi:hypothetical protein